MARETKVGLIVGLGVILFVSVFVSDYLSESTMDEDLAGQLPDFNQQTNNQTPVRVDESLTDDPATSDNLYAASLERVEERFGPSPTNRRLDPAIGTPPPRGGNPIPRDATADITPPTADERYTPPSDPVGIRRSIDEPRRTGVEAVPPERIGPAIGISEETIRVEIPRISARPRQTLHTVKSGENLSMIARKHYDGDGNMWRSIRDANPGKVGPNGEIRPGANLVIPKRSTEAVDTSIALGDPGDGSGNTRTRVRMV